MTRQLECRAAEWLYEAECRDWVRGDMDIDPFHSLLEMADPEYDAMRMEAAYRRLVRERGAPRSDD